MAKRRKPKHDRRLRAEWNVKRLELALHYRDELGLSEEEAYRKAHQDATLALQTERAFAGEREYVVPYDPPPWPMLTGEAADKLMQQLINSLGVPDRLLTGGF